VVETADLELARDDDMAAASWIRPCPTGAFGAVTRHVPDGYAAYVRLCHPAEDDAGQQVTWSTVAAATGRQAHPYGWRVSAQFHHGDRDYIMLNS
jgi:hypothetical protein